jgi:bacterioferritin
MDAVHPRVLGYLGRALSLELSAVQQYMTQASLAEIWGEADAADRFRRETVEELQHAERIVQRLLALGMAPGASQLQPVQAAADLVGLLRLDAVLESELIQHYTEATRFCALIGDREQQSFFAELLAEEQQHGREMASWLRELKSAESRLEERASF